MSFFCVEKYRKESKFGKENNESFKLLLLITFFFYRGKKIFFKFAMIQGELQKFILIIEKNTGYVVFTSEK